MSTIDSQSERVAGGQTKKNTGAKTRTTIHTRRRRVRSSPRGRHGRLRLRLTTATIRQGLINRPPIGNTSLLLQLLGRVLPTVSTLVFCPATVLQTADISYCILQASRISALDSLDSRHMFLSVSHTLVNHAERTIKLFSIAS